MATQKLSVPSVKNKDGNIEPLDNEVLYFYDKDGKHIGNLHIRVDNGIALIHWGDQLLYTGYDS